MADRTWGGPWRIIADLTPGGGTKHVTVTDPLGATCVTSTAVAEIGSSGRYVASVTSSGSDILDGLYTATWDDADSTKQDFTVGKDPDGATLTTLLQLVSDRVRLGSMGNVTTCSGTTLTDTSLFGGPDDYIGNYVLPAEDDENAGLARRVMTFDGSAMTLHAAFASDLAVGTEYALLYIDPREVQRELRAAIFAYAHAAYCPLRADGLTPNVDGVLTLPAGWDTVHQVYTLTSGDSEYGLLPVTGWGMLQNGKLLISGADNTTTVSLRGTREARYPVFPDSGLDFDASVLAEYLGSRVMSYRSGGQAVDTQAYLQRSNLGLQASGVLATMRTRRAPHNTTRIVW